MGEEQFPHGLSLYDGAAAEQEVDEVVLHKRSMLDADADFPLHKHAIGGASVGEFLFVDRFIEEASELVVDREGVAEHLLVDPMEIVLRDRGDGLRWEDRHGGRMTRARIMEILFYPS